jgi:dTDP-glucose pyrophosphorylase
MMPVAGKPMIARVMDMLAAAGLREFIIVAHPDDHELQNTFSSSIKVQVVFQSEQKGAAHALMSAAHLIKDNFVLSACDNLANHQEVSNFVQFFQNWPVKPPDGFLALMQASVENVKSMGMVTWDGDKIQRIVEKPAEGLEFSDLASMPLYCFSTRFLDFLPYVKPSVRGEYEIQEAIQLLIDETNDVHGKILSGRKTLTDAQDLLNLNLHFLEDCHTSTPAGFPGSVVFNPPCLVEPGVDLAEGCQIGPGVLIEAPSRIGRNAILRNTLVLRGAQVADGEIVENQVIA